ncbi:MAG: CotH kinase family protein [Saprospiraceae bacterium]|nr:CotH kinase family protein [Saprospiraceae bacterium]
MKQRFDNNDGNLFKGDPHGTLQWKGSQQNNYIGDYELKTNEDLNDWSDLIALLDALNNSSAADLQAALTDRLNLDSWYGYWATHSLFVNLDSYVGSGHNYYLYHNEDTDKFEFIAWDENEAFGNFKMGLSEQQLLNLPFTHIPQPFDQRPLMNRLLQNADMKQAYADRYCELLQDFSNEALDARIDSLADLIRTHVYEDTKKFYPNNVFEQNLSQEVSTPGGPQGPYIIAGLKPFINGRRTALLSQLANFGCVASAVETTNVEDELLIFPNPTSGHFFIKTGNQAISKVQIADLNGRTLQTWQGKIAAGQVEWPMQELASGIYLLKITMANGRGLLEKLVVMKN